MHSFTWGVVKDDPGTRVVYPICPQHEGVRVQFNEMGGQVTVICPGEPKHLLNACNREDFDAEREEATQRLAV